MDMLRSYQEEWEEAERKPFDAFESDPNPEELEFRFPEISIGSQGSILGGRKRDIFDMLARGYFPYNLTIFTDFFEDNDNDNDNKNYYNETIGFTLRVSCRRPVVEEGPVSWAKRLLQWEEMDRETGAERLERRKNEMPDGVIDFVALVYDVTRADTLQKDIKPQVEEIRRFCRHLGRDDPMFLLVGKTVDVREEGGKRKREVEEVEAERVTEEMRLDGLFECSAKERDRLQTEVQMEVMQDFLSQW